MDFVLELGRDGVTYTITEYKGSGKSVVVPSEMDGKRITAIGQGAFCESDAEEITISEGITTIGDSAFDSCVSLACVNFPASLARIEDYAFYNAVSLSSINLGDTATSHIGANAFSYCSALSSIEFPPSLESIGEKMTYNCPNLAHVSMNGSNGAYVVDNNCLIDMREKKIVVGCNAGAISTMATTIGKYAYSAYSAIESIDIPEGIEKIESGAFSYVTGARSLRIPSSVKVIGDWAFHHTESMVRVSVDRNNKFYIADNNAIIRRNDAKLIYGTKNTIISDKVHSIGHYAFYGVNDLTTIDIPSSVHTICAGAFSGMESLRNIVIPDSVKRMGESVFEDDESLESVTLPSGLEVLSEGMFSGCLALSDIVLPANLSSIEDGAFENCAALRCIVIPESVEVMREYIFDGCPDITVYARAEEKPDSWSDKWDDNSATESEKCDVVWAFRD